MSLRVEVSGISSRGLIRQMNEDRAAADGKRLVSEEPFDVKLAGDRHVLLVADGMGGHARGDVASDLALRALEAHEGDLQLPDECRAALRTANRAVFERGLSDSALRGMGSTIVGAALDGRQCNWFNVGDSRAYLLRGNAFRQLSCDHVPPRDTGITRGRSHAVTQSLGGTRTFTEVLPSMGTLRLELEDLVLLCSDGLTDVLADDEIAAALSCADCRAEAVRRLLTECLARGAPDNVTILIATLVR